MSKKRIYIILCSLLLCLTVFAVITPFSVSNTANAEPIIEEPDLPLPLEETKNYIFNLPRRNMAFNYGFSLDFDFISVMNGQFCNRMSFNESNDFISITFHTRNFNGNYSQVGGFVIQIVHDGDDWYYQFLPDFDIYNYMITVVNLPNDLFFTEFGEFNEDIAYFVRNFIVPTNYQIAYFVSLNNTSLLSNSRPTQSYEPDYLFRVVFNDGVNGGSPDVLLYYRHYYGSFNQVSRSKSSPTTGYFVNGPGSSVMPRMWFVPNILGLSAVPYNSSYVDSGGASGSVTASGAVGFKLGSFGSLMFDASSNNYGLISVSSPVFFVTIDNSLALDTIIYNSFHNGYALARDTYYDLGYDEGYSDGLSETLSDITPWQVIVNGVNSFLNIKVGYFSFAELLSIGLGLILLTLLMKFLT